VLEHRVLESFEEGAEAYSTVSKGSTLQLPGATGPELDFVDQLVEEILGLAHKILLGRGL